MSLRPRAKSAIKEDSSSSSSSSSQSPPSPSPSWSSSSLSQALAGTASLAKLLPTGTLLAFQLLTPVFTNHGACDPTARLLTLALLLLLALSCLLASFTDSVRIPPSHGRVYYGLATPRGLLLFDYPPADADADADAPAPDTSRYRLRPVDFVHAALSALVFGAVALRDANVLACFYPSPQRPEAREVLDVLPLGVGLLCSLLFVVFPTTRHGIGYPLSPAASASASSSN